MTTSLSLSDIPDTCPAGHDLTKVSAAHQALQEHCATLDAHQLIGDLRCMAPALISRLSPRLTLADQLGLLTFVGLVQRLDGDPGPTDNFIPPVEGAITGAGCTCHEPHGTTQRLNTLIDALNAHSAQHAADREASLATGQYL